ncbi:HK97 family phage prohead protease [Aeromonas sobria]|uniref:HK97 family phage prohead protease n=1 Tax=Aeromonas sobria TaxID=646 RepID=UPI0012FF4DD4|nr:HK97 family phage prohead protease [Aeromonas sobria]
MLKKEFQFDINTFDAKEGIFTGYGNTFDYKDYAGDITKRGAFVKSLNRYLQKGTSPALLWQHDTSKPIGVWTSAVEDEKGLLMTGRLVKGVQLADEALLLMAAGAISGLSIGYIVLDEQYDPKLKANLLLEVELLEVSLVTQPCNDMSRIQTVKSALLNGSIPSERDIERALKELGCSSRVAKTFIAGGYKSAFIDSLEDQEETEITEIINKDVETDTTDITDSTDADTENTAVSEIINTPEENENTDANVVSSEYSEDAMSEEERLEAQKAEEQILQLKALMALVKQL